MDKIVGDLEAKMEDQGKSEEKVEVTDVERAVSRAKTGFVGRLIGGKGWVKGWK